MNKPAEKKALSTDEKVDAILELLEKNGMTLPKDLKPSKDDKD